MVRYRTFQLREVLALRGEDRGVQPHDGFLAADEQRGVGAYGRAERVLHGRAEGRGDMRRPGHDRRS